MKHILRAISLSFLLIISTQANATFISGEYSFVGIGSFEATFSGNELTGVTFDDDIFVTSTYGDYDVFEFPTLGYIDEIDVTGQSGSIQVESLSSGAYGEFAITSVSADLSNWTIIEGSETGGSGSITLEGSLNAYLDDPDTIYQDTISQWVITLNSGGRTGSYSGTVPEPATLALFGMGLLGLSLARRNRKA